MEYGAYGGYYGVELRAMDTQTVHAQLENNCKKPINQSPIDRFQSFCLFSLFTE